MSVEVTLTSELCSWALYVADRDATSVLHTLFNCRCFTYTSGRGSVVWEKRRRVLISDTLSGVQVYQVDFAVAI